MTTHYIHIGKKTYPYTLIENDDNTVQCICHDANINQPFLPEDIGPLIIDLPDLIIAEKKYTDQDNQYMKFRISTQEKIFIQKKALQKGYKNTSEYLRSLALQN